MDKTKRTILLIMGIIAGSIVFISIIYSLGNSLISWTNQSSVNYATFDTEEYLEGSAYSGVVDSEAKNTYIVEYAVHAEYGISKIKTPVAVIVVDSYAGTHFYKPEGVDVAQSYDEAATVIRLQGTQWTDGAKYSACICSRDGTYDVYLSTPEPDMYEDLDGFWAEFAKEYTFSSAVPDIQTMVDEVSAWYNASAALTSDCEALLRASIETEDDAPNLLKNADVLKSLPFAGDVYVTEPDNAIRRYAPELPPEEEMSELVLSSDVSANPYYTLERVYKAAKSGRHIFAVGRYIGMTEPEDYYYSDTHKKASLCTYRYRFSLIDAESGICIGYMDISDPIGMKVNASNVVSSDGKNVVFFIDYIIGEFYLDMDKIG